MAKKNKLNPYVEGSDSYYSWMERNQPQKADSIRSKVMKEVGGRKNYKKLPNYASTKGRKK